MFEARRDHLPANAARPGAERCRRATADFFFFLIVEPGWVDPLFGQEAVDLGFKSVVALPGQMRPQK